jgi:hypothetical protein
VTCGPTVPKNGINVIKVPHGKAVSVRDSVLLNKFDPGNRECRLSEFIRDAPNDVEEKPKNH